MASPSQFLILEIHSRLEKKRKDRKVSIGNLSWSLFRYHLHLKCVCRRLSTLKIPERPLKSLLRFWVIYGVLVNTKVDLLEREMNRRVLCQP